MAGYKNIIYRNAEELMHKNSLFKEYENEIHITATNSLKAGMMKSNSESSLNRWFSGPIISFSELLRFLGNGWSKSKTNLKQFTLVSKALRQQSNSVSKEEREIFASMDKNQESILKTMRLLTESGYTSASVKNKILKNEISTKEKMFLDIWERIEEDESFKCLHEWFKALEQSPKKVFRKTLCEMFDIILSDSKKRIAANIMPGEIAKDLVYSRIKTGKKSVLVLHGFYFLVPIQKRLFDILSERFEIVHVINYEPNYEHGFETVECFLNVKNNFQRALEAPCGVNYHAKEFLLAINGEFIGNKLIKNEKNIAKINYLEFNTLQQLRRYTKNYNERYVSPRAMQISDFLKTIEHTEHTRLSEHPIGRFLVNIHRINKRKFDVKSGQFVDYENITYELLREILNSGYLYVDKVNAQSAIRILDFLQEITKTYTTFSDWETGLNHIIELKTQAENELKMPRTAFSKDDRMYSFYHESLGYFYAKEEEINFIQDAILKIKNLFELLFKGVQINIKQYIEILETHIENEIVSTVSDRFDKIIAQNIISKLDELKDDSLDQLDRKDLVQGLKYFLSQNPDLEDEYEMELYGGEEYKELALINSLLNSDGLQFEDNRVIHFALMDNAAFPTQQSLNVWPFSKESFNLLCYDNRYLNQLKMRKELEVEIGCYQFYLIMTNAVKINFSIVKQLDDNKKLKRSFYLNFLSLIQGSNQQLKTLLNNQLKPTYKLEKIEFNQQKYDYMPRTMFNRCPKRFTYTFLLDYRPSFYDAFHEPFLFQQLIQYDYRFLGETKNFKMYRSWFPHWSESKKDIYEASSKEYMKKEGYKYKKKFTFVGNWRYNDIRVGLNLFGSRSEGENINGADDPLEENKFLKLGENCKYCPYQKICTDSTV